MLFDSVLVIASLKSCQFSRTLYFPYLLKWHFLMAISLKFFMRFASSSKESTVKITLLSSLSCSSLLLGVESRQLLSFSSQGRHVPRTSWGGVCSCIVHRDTQCPVQMSRLSLWSGGHIQEWSTPFYDISLGLIALAKYLCLFSEYGSIEYLTNLDETGLVMFLFQLKLGK